MRNEPQLLFDINKFIPLLRSFERGEGEICLTWRDGGGELRIGDLRVEADICEPEGYTPAPEGIDASLELDMRMLRYLNLGIVEGAKVLRIELADEVVVINVKEYW